MRTRQAILIDRRDEQRIIAALERLPEQEGFVGLRTRAFVYLLWDGALRTGAAIWLNAEEVVRDPGSSRVHVVQEAVLRPCEGNRYRARQFVVSDRARDAVAGYLKAARSGGWLANGPHLEGPLWIATQAPGIQKRMSQRTAVQSWRRFIESVKGLAVDDYQLDDVVLTGRVAFVQAAGSADAISDHAGISAKWAGHYSDHVSSRSTTREVMSQLNQKHKRKA